MAVDRNEYEQVPSRFERLIVQTSFLDAIIKSRKATRGTNKRLRSKPPKQKKALRGTAPVNKMFSGKLTFAPAYNDDKVDYGTPWSEPMPNPRKNKPYFIKLGISRIPRRRPAVTTAGVQDLLEAPAGLEMDRWAPRDDL